MVPMNIIGERYLKGSVCASITVEVAARPCTELCRASSVYEANKIFT